MGMISFLPTKIKKQDEPESAAVTLRPVIETDKAAKPIKPIEATVAALRTKGDVVKFVEERKPGVEMDPTMTRPALNAAAVAALKE